MNVDELQNQLADYNRKLDESLRLNARLLRETRLQRVGSSLRRLSLFLWMEVIIDAVAVFLLGRLIFDHRADLRFLTPAIVLDVCAILLVVSGARQLAALSRIDYAAPLLVIQRRLGLLKAQRIRITRWVLILSPLVWTPLLIVGLQVLFGVNFYAFGGVWLACNLIFGIAFLIAMVWASRRYADRMQGSPAIQRLMNSLAGPDLNKAMAFLESLSRLEQEDERA